MLSRRSCCYIVSTTTVESSLTIGISLIVLSSKTTFKVVALMKLDFASLTWPRPLADECSLNDLPLALCITSIKRYGDGFTYSHGLGLRPTNARFAKSSPSLLQHEQYCNLSFRPPGRNLPKLKTGVPAGHLFF